MSKPFHVWFDATELVNETYNIFDIARNTGEIKIGTIETTRALEKRKAKLIIIAEDTDPPEVVAHLPYFCEDIKVPYTYVPSKHLLGEKCGFDYLVAAVAITDLGKASDLYKSFLDKLEKVKKERKIEH